MLKLWPDCSVTASDLDPVSVDVLRKNAVINDLSLGEGAGEISALCAEDVQDATIHARAPYDLITANILAAPLIDMAPRLAGVLAQGGTLILSGLLQTQEHEVLAAYEAERLSLDKSYPTGEWQCLILKRAD